jgi:uncharacterized surface protein with fasciclin (FAS1) repeats
MRSHELLLFLAGLHLVHTQSLIDAISGYRTLSNFTQLVKQNPAFAGIFNATNQGTQITILIPSDTAFSRYQNDTGYSIQDVDASTVKLLIQYHTLNASLTSSELGNPDGIVVSSQLVDPQYDNRGSDSNVPTPGQVVYISSNSSSSLVNGGLGSAVVMNVVDGAFDHGVFQIVDQ